MARDRGPALAGVGAFLVVGLMKGLSVPDPDTPWHVATGRLVLHRWARGTLGPPRIDPFSWTAVGRPWHPNAWLFDALLAGTKDVAGWGGVALLREALLAIVVVLAWQGSRRSRVGPWARAAAVWAMAFYLLPSSAVRPQLPTYVLLLVAFRLTHKILDREREAGPPWRGLLVLGGVFALWANLHGVVVLGILAVAAACLGNLVDCRFSSWRRSLLVAAVAFAGGCMSPYGLTIWPYAVATARASRRVAEQQHASIHLARDVFICSSLLLVTAWALAQIVRRRPAVTWRLLIPSLLLTAFALDAVRNESLALLAAVPLGAGALADAGAWLGRHGAGAIRPGGALAAMTVGCLIAGPVLHPVTLSPNPDREPAFPVTAARQVPSTCRLLNEYAQGGYLLLVHPDVPVSEDPRTEVYGDRELAHQSEFLNDPDPDSVNRDLQARGVSCVLASRARPILRALAEVPDWHLVATDRADELWMRAGQT